MKAELIEVKEYKGASKASNGRTAIKLTYILDIVERLRYRAQTYAAADPWH